MQNLSRVFVPLIIRNLTLVAGEDTQSIPRQARIEQQRLVVSLFLYL